MERPSFVIRQPRLDELPGIAEMSLGEGWTTPDGFLELYYSLQPSSYFIAATPGGEILCFCIGFRVGETHGRIARLVTEKKYRQLGIGREVLSKALGYLDGRHIGLDAVTGQTGQYVSRGFIFSDFDCYCVEGLPDRTAIDNLQIPEADVTVHPVQEVNMVALIQYDTKIHIVEREEFLRKWLDPSRAVTLCAKNKNGDVTGYICKWMKETGAHRIGPFFANELWIARMLWKAIIGLIPDGEKVYIRIPDKYQHTLHLASSTIMNEPYLTGTRMYNKEMYNIPLDRVYGVTDCDCSVI